MLQTTMPKTLRCKLGLHRYQWSSWTTLDETECTRTGQCACGAVKIERQCHWFREESRDVISQETGMLHPVTVDQRDAEEITTYCVTSVCEHCGAKRETEDYSRRIV